MPAFQMPNASSTTDASKVYDADGVCQSSDDAQLSAIGRTYANECEQWINRAVCLSTNASAESLGYGISVGTNATWVPESRIGQSADESCSASWWPIGGG
jgi:hypothetical protein